MLLRNPSNINQLVFHVNKMYDSQERKLKSAASKPIYQLKGASLTQEKTFYNDYNAHKPQYQPAPTLPPSQPNDNYPMILNGPIILSNENTSNKQ